jgi:hypothetical protein
MRQNVLGVSRDWFNHLVIRTFTPFEAEHLRGSLKRRDSIQWKLPQSRIHSEHGQWNMWLRQVPSSTPDQQAHWYPLSLIHLMPQSIIGLDTLLLAVIIIHLSKAEDIQCELQAIIVVEKLNATSNGKHNVGVVLNG